MLPCRDISALAWAHELGGLQSPMSCPTVQESTHHMKKEAKGEKGASIATAATENGESVAICFLFR